MIYTTPTIEALDRRLLCDALRTMIRRFEDVARQSGATDTFIERCTEHEAALLNRVQLSLEAGK